MTRNIRRKPVVVIHPFKGKGGENETNINKILAICRGLKDAVPGAVLIVPVFNFIYLDDEAEEERRFAIETSKDLIRIVAAVDGEAWVFGQYQNSEGCLGEIKLAEELGMTIRYWGER